MRVVPEAKVLQINRYHGRINDKPNLRMYFHSKPATQRILRKSILAQDDNLFVDDIPGMKHLLNVEKPAWFKIIWSFVLLMSTCLCAYQITDRIKLYLNKPVLTETKFLSNSTIKAPSVTVCPRSENIHKDWFEDHGCTCLPRPPDPDCCDMYLHLMDKCNTTQVWDAIHYKRFLNSVELLERNALATLVKTINIPATLTDILTVEGTCITASFDQPIPFHGEQLSIMVKTNDEKLMCNASHIGNVYVHEDNVDMTYIIEGKALQLSSTTYLTYGLTTRTFQALNRTDRPCTSIEEINKCQTDCIEKRILELGAKCSLPYMKTTKLKPCTNSKSALDTFRISLFVTSTLSLEKDCKCLRKCETNMYTLYYQTMGEMDHSVIFLFFPNNIVESITENYSYTIVDLFCDLGGNLGLYLGLCIPTIIDVVQSMIVLVLKKI